MITKTTAKKTTAKKTTKGAAKKSAAKKTTKSSAKKSSAKSVTKKTPAKKSSAKKTTKSSAQKTAAKKTTKSSAKKTPAKKTPAKKTSKVSGGGAAGGGKDGFAKKIAKITARAAAAGVELPAGASEAAIVAAEQELGATFPAEVRAWFAAHDGAGEQFIADNRELLSLQRVVSEWKIWKGLLDEGTFEDNDHGSPGPGVQQVWWIPEWIPLSYDGAGNHDVLDLAPASGGKVGQILSFWHDDDVREVIAPNMLDWLLGVTWGAGGE